MYFRLLCRSFGSAMSTRNVSVLLLSLVSFSHLHAQDQKSRATIQEKTDQNKLREIKDDVQQSRQANKSKAQDLAKEKGWALKKELENGAFMELQGVSETGHPIYYITHNTDAAKTISTDKVWPGGSLGLNLSGNGMDIAMWDGGATRLSHQEFQGRATQQDDAVTLSDHACHVAGTMIAGGVDADAKGGAYEATFLAYDWNDDEAEMATFAENGGLISNHSYGAAAGWEFENGSWVWFGDGSVSTVEDYRNGFYSSDAKAWDDIAFAAPYYTIFKSAGNDRGDGPGTGPAEDDGGTLGFDCISDKGVSKNIITVGAAHVIPGGYTQPSDVQITDFSGFGPADDGRIKPDIVANGFGVYSSSKNGDASYTIKNGTSMATPSASGSALLVQQHYNNLHPGEFMRAATLKGLLIHTADEAGSNPGPDYSYGWGLMNTSSAVTAITNENNGTSTYFGEHLLQDGQNHSYNLTSDGSPLKVTISWTDPSGTPISAALDPTDLMLVNDLDSRIDGTIMPWTLNPSSPQSAASTGDNFRDNIEQLNITSPTNGNDYNLVINHKNSLLGGSQAYSIIITGVSSVSESPVAAFLSDKQILYQDATVQFSDQSFGASSWSWDFGAGATPATATGAGPHDVTYASGSKKTISLTVNGSATTTLSDFLHVIPKRPLPYTLADGGNFESSSDDFTSAAVSGDINIWERGIPGNELDQASSGSNVWKTDLDGDVGRPANDYKSAVFGPSFDFSQSGTYTLKMVRAMEYQFCNGPFAVNVEYTLDNGTSWILLGDVDDGKGTNWYNRNASSGCPISEGVIESQTGWTTNSSGSSASYDVSGFSGNNTIAFRVVFHIGSGFNSESGYEKDGFSFDDFEVDFVPATAEFTANKTVTYPGSQITFTDESVVASSWNWSFGANATPSTATGQGPHNVTYSTGGLKDVALTIDGSNTTTKTSYVHVLPSKAVPYTPGDGGDFESNPNDFAGGIISGEINLWERGAPSNALATVNSGSNVWKTDLDSDVIDDSYHCALYAPSFNMSTAGSYTLKFRKSMEIEFCNAPIAVNVHYSTDGGATWSILGAFGDGNGVNWYNKDPDGGCPIHTAVIPEQQGWITNRDNENTEYDISFLGGNSAVAFRIVLYVEDGFSAAGYTNDGFMVDDFEIEGPPSSPTPNFSADLNTLCENDVVTYTDASTGSVVTYAWNFGSGASPATANTAGPHTVTYSSSGAKTVSLTINGTEVETKTDFVTVNAIPSAPTAGGLQACEGETIPSLTTTGTNPIWYSDALLQNEVGTGTSFNTGLTDVGSYAFYVTQTVGGCTSSASTVDLLINAKPMAPFGNNETVCQGESVPDLFASGGSITWYSNSGLTNQVETGPSYSTGITASGTHNFYATITDGNCEGPSQQITLQINAKPSAPSASNQSASEGGTIPDLTATGSNITWYSNVGLTTQVGTGSSFATGQTAAATYTYYVTQTTNGCESNGTEVTLTITSITPPTIANVARCGAGDVSMTATGAPGGGTYNWYANATGGSPLFTGAIFTPTLSTTKTYHVTVEDGGAESARTAVTATVKTIPSVDAGSSNTVCADASAITMSGFSPSGGTWSGNGIDAGGTFTPSTGLVGTQTLTYSVTQNGCTGTSTKSVTVNAVPSTSAGSDNTVCANSTAFNLQGFSPAGGTWSGNGVSSGGLFTPSSSLDGNQTLIYTVTQDGCSATDTRVVTVNLNPDFSVSTTEASCGVNDGSATVSSGSGHTYAWSNGQSTQTAVNLAGGNVDVTVTETATGCANTQSVSINSAGAPSASFSGLPSSMCSNEAEVSLIGIPSSGSFSGNGVSGTNFNPALAGAGSHTIIYSVTESGCTGSESKIVVVTAAPNVVAGSNLTVCSGDPAFMLSGFSPAGGFWIGNGVNTLGEFSPSENTGTNTLTYSVTENGCSAQDERTVVVNTTPSVDAGITEAICANASAFTVQGASPSGGTWSGNGISASGLFTPATNLVGSQLLNYVITQNGCSASASKNMIVNPIPSFIVETTDENCGSADGTAFADLGEGVSGFSYSWSNGQSNPTATGLAGGNYNVTVINDNTGCALKKNFSVNSIGAPTADFSGLDAEYCESDNTSSLVGTPTGGTFSGPGISGSNFNPSIAGAGSHTVIYSVSENGCVGTKSQNVIVHASPVVEAGAVSTLCDNANDVTITGFSPSGGTWAGTGVTSSGVFSPTTVGNGTHLLTYSVSANGCTGVDTKVITVNQAPNTTAGGDQGICSNANSITLSGTPNGGTWSGPGVSQSGTFTPSAGLTGDNMLTYTATANGCSASDDKILTVHATPDYTITTTSANCGSPDGTATVNIDAGAFTFNWSNDQTTQTASDLDGGSYTVTVSNPTTGCSVQKSITVNSTNAPTVTLTGLDNTYCNNAAAVMLSGTPSGGTYSGNGVSGNQFNPAMASEGNNIITYTVDDAGCIGSATKTVNVIPTPLVDAGADVAFCSDASATSLIGFSPSGGTWSGDGVSTSGIYSPSSGLVGEHTLTYSVTQNGCTATDNRTVSVSESPIVDAGSDFTICANEAAVTLSSATPSGGTWSGNGVNQAGIFTPSANLIGKQTLIYSAGIEGCQAAESIEVTVNAAPMFTVATSNATCGQSDGSATVNLSGSYTYLWSDNQTGISASGLEAGSYSVTVTSQENGCANVQPLTVNNEGASNVTLSGLVDEYCADANIVNLLGSPTGGTLSGNGISGMTFDPASAGPGVHTIAYSVSENGCTGSATMEVTVSQNPVFTLDVYEESCAGDDGFALINESGPWDFNWSNGSILDFASDLPAGNYDVTVTNQANGCSTNQPFEVETIDELFGFIDGLEFQYCANADTSHMSGFPSGGIIFGEGVIDGYIFDPSLANPDEFGQAYVYYILSENGCTDTIEQVVFVDPLPEYTVETTDASCGNSDGEATIDIGFGLGDWIFDWSDGQDTETATGLLAGVYSITVTDDFTFCSNTKIVTINDIGGTPVDFTGLPATACLEDAASILEGTPSGGVFFGEGTGFGDFDPSLSGPGTFDIVYSYFDGSCNSSATKTITVFESPSQPAIFSFDDTLYADVFADSYIWYKNNGEITGESDYYLPLISEGNFQVQAVENGCLSPLSEGFIHIFVGVAEASMGAGMNLFPNPLTSDRLTVEGNGFAAGSKVILTVTNELGISQYTIDTFAGNNGNVVHQLPIELASGTYMVTIQSDENHVSGQVIVLK